MEIGRKKSHTISSLPPILKKTHQSSPLKNITHNHRIYIPSHPKPIFNPPNSSHSENKLLAHPHLSDADKKNLYAFKMKMLMCNRPLKIMPKPAIKDDNKSSYGLPMSRVGSKSRLGQKSMGVSTIRQMQETIDFDPISSSLKKQEKAKFGQKNIEFLIKIEIYIHAFIDRLNKVKGNPTIVQNSILLRQMQAKMSNHQYLVIGNSVFEIRQIFDKNLYCKLLMLERVGTDHVFCLYFNILEDFQYFSGRVILATKQAQFQKNNTISHLYCGTLFLLKIKQIKKKAEQNRRRSNINSVQQQIQVRIPNQFGTIPYRKRLQYATWLYEQQYLSILPYFGSKSLPKSKFMKSWPLHKNMNLQQFKYIWVKKHFDRQIKKKKAIQMTKIFYQHKKLQIIKITVILGEKWIKMQIFAKNIRIFKSYICLLDERVNKQSMQRIKQKCESSKDIKNQIMNMGMRKDTCEGIYFNKALSQYKETTGQFRVIVKVREGRKIGGKSELVYFLIRVLIFEKQNLVILISECSSQYHAYEYMRFFSVSSFQSMFPQSMHRYNKKYPQNYQNPQLIQQIRKQKPILSSKFTISINSQSKPVLLFANRILTPFPFDTSFKFIQQPTFHLCFQAKNKIMVFRVKGNSNLLRFSVFQNTSQIQYPRFSPQSFSQSLSLVHNKLKNNKYISYHYDCSQNSILDVKSWSQIIERRGNVCKRFDFPLKSFGSFMDFPKKEQMVYWKGMAGMRACRRVIKVAKFQLVHYRQRAQSLSQIAVLQ